MHDFALARYNMDGSLDPSFGGSGAGKVTTDLGGEDSALGLVLDPLGRIVVAGSTCDPPALCQANFALARYGAGGSLDTSFGSAGKITPVTFARWIEDADFLGGRPPPPFLGGSAQFCSGNGTVSSRSAFATASMSESAVATRSPGLPEAIKTASAREMGQEER